MKIKLLLGIVAALALVAAVTPQAVAQEEAAAQEEQVVEPDDGGLGLAYASAVLPGLETSGNGSKYVLLDSLDAGGPTFNSPAYSPTTRLNTVSEADNINELINFGFAFNFYGTDYASAYVSPNGALIFNAASGATANGDLSIAPGASTPAIYAFWDDLFPGGSVDGEVRVDTFGSPGSRVLVVEYHDVFRIGPESSGGTFQIRLFETSNVIEFHYFDLDWGGTPSDFGASATVGIRNGAAGEAYLQYVTDSPQIGNGTALRLWQPTCFGMEPTLVGDRGDDDMLLITIQPTGFVYYGHHGNDTLHGGGLSNRLCGGYGDDILLGGPEGDFMDAGPGNDTLDGDLGVDRMWGRGGNDTFDGGGGSDRMWGGGGNDIMNGFSGADRMWGGPGDDTMNGHGGQDSMWGEDGNDTMQGNHQTDNMWGGPGNDVIAASGGKDKIWGGPGDDIMRGGDNTDYLNGEGGFDNANGQRGKDNPLIHGVSGCVAEVKVSC